MCKTRITEKRQTLQATHQAGSSASEVEVRPPTRSWVLDWALSPLLARHSRTAGSLMCAMGLQSLCVSTGFVYPQSLKEASEGADDSENPVFLDMA